MVRLDTLVVTSLKPSGQRRSFQFRTYFFCVILGTLVASATISFANETSPRSSARFITTAHEVRYLTIEQAKQGRAVHLTGVITYYDPEEPDLFIQDASGGIWAKPNEPLSAGDLVEIDGVTEAPDFAPQVGRPCFQSDRTSSVIPPARRVSFVEMSSTQEDSQRVEVEGVVHKVFKKGNRLFLEVTTADDDIIGRLPFYKREAPTTLVDARVRIRGTCGAQFNSANQITGVYINIPYESKIEILKPSPADAFNIREAEKITGKRIPIVAMTAHALKGDQDRCIAAGMDRYVSKPIRSIDLFALMERLLAGKPAANSLYNGEG